MWEYHNKQMLNLRKTYKRISKQTQIRLQEIFKVLNLDYENLFEIANEKIKDFINVKIEEWREKGILKGYFGVLANNIYRRSRIKNSEILELLIYGTYVEEQNKLEEYEKQIIYNDLNYYFIKGQEEVNNYFLDNEKKEILTLTDIMFLSLLALNDSSGYNFNTYKQTIVKNNSDKIYRQAIVNITQQKELDINDIEFQSIINRQIDNKIKIKENKVYGAIDYKLIELNNKAKIEGMLQLDKKAKVRFISDMCENVTPMCKNMDGMIFSVNDYNEFVRYVGSSLKDIRIQKIKVKGIVQGVNLPPINSFFHWCHSTIEYVSIKNIYKDNNVDISMDSSEYGNMNVLTSSIVKICDELYAISKENGYENIVLIDDKTQVQKGKSSTSKSINQVEYSIEQQNLMQISKDRSLIVVHNHPSNNTFSLADIFEMVENRKVNGIIVVTDEFYYFLNANQKELDLCKKNITYFKKWFYNAIEKNLSNNLTNEMFNEFYKKTFEVLGWNYGRKRKS